MLKDEELLSNFEGNMVGSDDDQKTTNDTHSDVNNGTYEYNTCDTHIYTLILQLQMLLLAIIPKMVSIQAFLLPT